MASLTKLSAKRREERFLADKTLRLAEATINLVNGYETQETGHLALGLCKLQSGQKPSVPASGK